MAKLIQPSSQVAPPVQQPVMANAGAFQADTRGLQAVGQMGQAVAQLGDHLKKIEDTRQVANGIAKYNNLINSYNESLVGKDPDTYMDGFEELQEKVGKIYDGMSNTAQATLQNRITIWNETNRASIANLAVKNKISLIKQEIPINLASFAENGQDVEAEKYINGLETMLAPGELDIQRKLYKDMKRDNTIWRYINISVQDGSKEAYDSAKEFIEDNQPDERVKHSMIRTLDADFAVNRQKKDMAEMAQIHYDSMRAIGAAVGNEPITMETHRDIQPYVDILAERQKNGTLAISPVASMDTYNFAKENINFGEYYEPDEMLQIYAEGLSTSQYNELSNLNEENKKIDPQKIPVIKRYAGEIRRNMNGLRTIADGPSIMDEAKDVVRAAIDDAELDLTMKVKGWVLEDMPAEQIRRNIREEMDGSVKGIVQPIWQQNLIPFFHLGDIEPEIVSETDRQERYDVVMELLKSGQKRNIKRLNALVKEWE